VDQAGDRLMTAPDRGAAPSRRARVIRYARRALPERAEQDAILAAGLVAHVGFEQAGQPYVLPMTYLYRDGRLFLHGSKASRQLRHLASGAPVCVTVTIVDSLVASKAAAGHSMNYRSVVVFGRGKPVRSRAAQVELSHAIIARYFPDRAPGEAYRVVSDDELQAVRIVEVEIEELSAKRRDAGPLNALDDDADAPGWNGVLPLPRER
jgi:nitroimidazol reductase NimA-like FMN-containing flavoprotein (pyridoxamine 5'-phosphate oxidase superfamily)